MQVSHAISTDYNAMFYFLVREIVSGMFTISTVHNYYLW